jgi:hypothetical protein
MVKLFKNLNKKRSFITAGLIAVIAGASIGYVVTKNNFKAAEEEPSPNLISNQAKLTYYDSQSQEKTVYSNITQTTIASFISIPLQFADSTSGWAILANPSDHELTVDNYSFVKDDVEKNWGDAYLAGWIGEGYKWDLQNQGLLAFGCADDPCWKDPVIGTGMGFWLQLPSHGVTMKVTP